MDKQQWKGTMLVLFSALAFGIMPTLSKLSFQEGLNVNSILFFRFSIAAMIIWIYIFARKIPYKTSRKHTFYLFILSLIGYVGTSSTLFIAFTHISGALATVLLFTHPAMIVVYEICAGKTKIDLRKTLSLIVSMIGIILVVWNHSFNFNAVGILLSLLSAVLYSFYILGLEESKTKEMDAISITGYVLLFSAIVYFLQGTVTHTVVFPRTIHGWIYLLILALFSSVFAIFALCIGVKLVGPSKAAIISTFEPVFAAVLGVWVIHEPVSLSMIMGSALILSSVLILQIPRKSFESTKLFQK